MQIIKMNEYMKEGITKQMKMISVNSLKE